MSEIDFYTNQTKLLHVVESQKHEIETLSTTLSQTRRRCEELAVLKMELGFALAKLIGVCREVFDEVPCCPDLCDWQAWKKFESVVEESDALLNRKAEE